MPAAGALSLHGGGRLCEPRCGWPLHRDSCPDALLLLLMMMMMAWPVGAMVRCSHPTPPAALLHRLHPAPPCLPQRTSSKHTTLTFVENMLLPNVSREWLAKRAPLMYPPERGADSLAWMEVRH